MIDNLYPKKTKEKRINNQHLICNVLEYKINCWLFNINIEIVSSKKEIKINKYYDYYILNYYQNINYII